MSLLVGDIGGTRVRLQLLADTPGGRSVLREIRCESRDFDSLEQALTHCLETLSAHQRRSINRACLAVAGSVRDGRVRFTNLSWDTDTDSVAAHLQLKRVQFINDLEALAGGIALVAPERVRTLKPGTIQGERRLVVAVGTGLGMALSMPGGVVDSEGGHVDFAPADDSQLALWRWLRQRHDHVSYERVLSGEGLTSMYEFLCARRNRDPGWHYGPGRRHPAAVTAGADAGEPTAQAALDMFSSVLGAFAGNAMLYGLASGGVYIAGGVAAALGGRLSTDVVTRGFVQKGRMSALLSEVPVLLVDDADAGLAGAARAADDLLS